MFNRNIGPLDRIVRVTLGGALLAFAATAPGAIWALIGIVPLATGLSGRCPLYSMLHIDTRTVT